VGVPSGANICYDTTAFFLICCVPLSLPGRFIPGSQSSPFCPLSQRDGVSIKREGFPTFQRARVRWGLRSSSTSFSPGRFAGSRRRWGQLFFFFPRKLFFRPTDPVHRPPFRADLFSLSSEVPWDSSPRIYGRRSCWTRVVFPFSVRCDKNFFFDVAGPPSSRTTSFCSGRLAGSTKPQSGAEVSGAASGVLCRFFARQNPTGGPFCVLTSSWTAPFFFSQCVPPFPPPPFCSTELGFLRFGSAFSGLGADSSYGEIRPGLPRSPLFFS